MDEIEPILKFFQLKFQIIWLKIDGFTYVGHSHLKIAKWFTHSYLNYELT